MPPQDGVPIRAANLRPKMARERFGKSISKLVVIGNMRKLRRSSVTK